MSIAGPLLVARAGPDDAIAVLTLHRPAALNAIDDALVAALHGVLDELEA